MGSEVLERVAEGVIVQCRAGLEFDGTHVDRRGNSGCRVVGNRIIHGTGMAEQVRDQSIGYCDGSGP